MVAQIDLDTTSEEEDEQIPIIKCKMIPWQMPRAIVFEQVVQATQNSPQTRLQHPVQVPPPQRMPFHQPQIMQNPYQMRPSLQQQIPLQQPLQMLPFPYQPQQLMQNPFPIMQNFALPPNRQNQVFVPPHHQNQAVVPPPGFFNQFAFPNAVNANAPPPTRQDPRLLSNLSASQSPFQPPQSSVPARNLTNHFPNEHQNTKMLYEEKRRKREEERQRLMEIRKRNDEQRRRQEEERRKRQYSERVRLDQNQSNDYVRPPTTKKQSRWNQANESSSSNKIENEIHPPQANQLNKIKIIRPAPKRIAPFVFKKEQMRPTDSLLLYHDDKRLKVAEKAGISRENTPKEIVQDKNHPAVTINKTTEKTIKEELQSDSSSNNSEYFPSTDSGDETDNDAYFNVISPVSTLNKLALKLNLTVAFELKNSKNKTKASRNFTMICKTGKYKVKTFFKEHEILINKIYFKQTDGRGTTEKLAEKKAASKMIKKLSDLPSAPTTQENRHEVRESAIPIKEKEPEAHSQTTTVVATSSSSVKTTEVPSVASSVTENKGQDTTNVIIKNNDDDDNNNNNNNVTKIKQEPSENHAIEQIGDIVNQKVKNERFEEDEMSVHPSSFASTDKIGMEDSDSDDMVSDIEEMCRNPEFLANLERNVNTIGDVSLRVRNVQEINGEFFVFALIKRKILTAFFISRFKSKIS